MSYSSLPRSSNRRASINDVKLPADLVKKLSPEMLKELNRQDEATFYAFFEGLNLEDVKLAQQRREQVRAMNRDIAAKNLELEPKFEQCKTQLIEKSAELNSLKEDYDKKLLELKAFQNKRNHESVAKELAQTARKTEQDSEDLAADFVGGKSSLALEEFQEKFIELRTLYWLRKVKTEKMKELVANIRPTPAPRTFHNTTGFLPPLQSLPAQSNPSPGYSQEPASSLPPYPSQSTMPVPNNPFPAAAYTKPGPPKPAPYVPKINQHRF